jgi:hypothetical protein
LSKSHGDQFLISAISDSIDADFLDNENCLDLLSAKLIAIFPNKVDIEFRQKSGLSPALNYADEFKVGAFTIELDRIRIKAVSKKGIGIEFLISNRQNSSGSTTKELNFKEFKYELSRLVAFQAKKNSFLKQTITALLAPQLN